MKSLLSTAYFGPIQYYSKIVNSEKVLLEAHENFLKQTYRSRCKILGANGPLTISIPIVGGRAHKIAIRDAKIDYATNWQHVHWQSIISAYKSSPYFEYYEDDIAHLFEQKKEFLWDLNQEIHEIVMGWIDSDKELIHTSEYIKETEDYTDYRLLISPKRKTEEDSLFVSKEYTQVFSEKYDFSPNLSILDLVFNEGPNALCVLEDSIS